MAEPLEPFGKTPEQLEEACSLSPENIQALKRLQFYLQAETWENLLKGSIWSLLTGTLFKNLFGNVNKDLLSDISNLKSSIEEATKEKMKELNRLRESIEQYSDISPAQALEYLKKKSERITDEISWWGTTSSYVNDLMETVEHCLGTSDNSHRSSGSDHYLRAHDELRDDLTNLGVSDPYFSLEPVNLEFIDISSGLNEHYYLARR